MLKTTLLAASALCVFAQNELAVATNAEAKRVAVQNGVAYIADSTYGLTIANKDRVLGGLAMSGVVRDVAVKGNWAFTVGADGVVKVDVSDSANPVKTATYANTGGDRLTVVGNYAYVAADTDGLLIIDVRTMTLTSQYKQANTLHRFTAVAVLGDYAFVSDYGMGLIVLNIANKAAPTRIASHAVTTAFDIEVQGNTVYVASYTSGLVIVDVSNKMVPVRLSIYGTKQNLHGLSVMGNTVVLAAGELYFVNVEDAVIPVGTMYTLPTGSASDAVYTQGMVFVAANSAGLVVLPEASIPAPATPSPPVTPTPAPGSSSDDDLSETAIAAIVIGCVLFVVIVVMIVLFFTLPAKTEVADAEPEAEAEEVVEEKEEENHEPIEP